MLQRDPSGGMGKDPARFGTGAAAALKEIWSGGP